MTVYIVSFLVSIASMVTLLTTNIVSEILLYLSPPMLAFTFVFGYCILDELKYFSKKPEMEREQLKPFGVLHLILLTFSFVFMFIVGTHVASHFVTWIIIAFIIFLRPITFVIKAYTKQSLKDGL